MENQPISDLAYKAIVDDNLLELILNKTSNGIVIFAAKNKRLIYSNQKAKQLCSPDEPGKEKTSFYGLFSKEEFALLKAGKFLNCRRFGKVLKISLTETKGYQLFIIIDMTAVTKAENDIDKIRQLNRELQTAFDQYADESIFITDNKGIVEFVGKEIVKNCGLDSSYFIGKTVYDLEKERIFYPSVTVRVLETGQSQVVIQSTKNNPQVVSLGAPILNDNGEIEKVVSISRNYATQIKIGALLSDLASSTLFLQEEDENSFDRIVTCSEKMFQIKALIKLVAGVNSTILINGETGTGKEMMAKLIYNLSKRKNKPFIKVNCGAIAPNLVESELFGYEPGSFTGASREGKVGLIEAANQGTLFLDEISELPLDHQVKLLQVLQERSMLRVGGTIPIDLDIRIIAATNRNLETLVEEGKFREDLFYRLNVVPINIPPLRERRDDIPLLVKHFLDFFNATYDMQKQISKEALILMSQYSWPGNVRELENTVERLIVTTEKHIIDSDQLPGKIRSLKKDEDSVVMIKDIMNLNEAIEQTEKKLIQMALDKYGTATRAADALGVNQSTVSRKIAQYKMLPKKKHT